ncbi:MAG: hypothetical protein AAGK93_00260 [Pseudomonadota bacterium]
MKPDHKPAVWLMLAGTLALAATAYLPAFASSGMENEYTDKACLDTSTAICGAVIIADAGSFTLDWTTVKARDTQPNPPTMHPACPGVNKKFDDNVPGGNYNKYVVPASCAYKVKLKILGGNGKDQTLYLTPGCKIMVKVKGDLASNKITVDAEKISSQTPVNANGKPVDQQGYKCGKQSKAGF